MTYEKGGLIHFEEGDAAQERFAKVGSQIRLLCDEAGVPPNERVMTLVNVAAYYLGNEVKDDEARQHLTEEFVKVFRAKVEQAVHE